MRGENIESSRSGRPVVNQYIIIDDDGNRFFQSYDSIVAKIDCQGEITLDKNYYDYSRTTIKYRNQFLGMSTKQVNDWIQAGKIVLVDLNGGY